MMKADAIASSTADRWPVKQVASQPKMVKKSKSYTVIAVMRMLKERGLTSSSFF